MVRLGRLDKGNFRRIFFFILLIIFFFASTSYALDLEKDRVYDYADLITDEEERELNIKLDKYSKKRKTDIVIVTTDEVYPSGHMKFNEDFFEREKLGYKARGGNTVLLSVNIASRDFSVLGFAESERYLDRDRREMIIRAIKDELTAGDYYKAFDDYADRAYEYLGIRPGINPNSILFSNVFIGFISIIVGGSYIGVLLRKTGGSMTVDDRTYRDFENTEVLDKKDRYIRTSVTRTRIERNNNNNNSSGGSSGSGRTSGGSSYGGSSGKF